MRARYGALFLHLQKRKEQLDREICGLKEKNMLILASSLTTIGELENIDMNVILGVVLKAIKDIKDDEKEVLRNSGHSFLKKYKARIPGVILRENIIFQVRKK